MTSDRKEPTAGFWITVALVAVLVVVLYPQSAGPAAMRHDKLGRPGWTYRVIYHL